MRPFCLVVFLACWQTTIAEPLLRQVRAVADYMDRTPNETIRFELTGTVLQTGETIRSNFTGTVLLGDDSGRVSVFSSLPILPSPGSIVHVSGDGHIERDGNPCVCIRQMTVVGERPLPAALNIPLGNLFDPIHAHRLIRTEGTLIEVVNDEVDDRNGFLLLKDGDAIIPVSIRRNDMANVQSLVGARLRVCGRYNSRIDGIRRYSGPFINQLGPFEIVKPAPADPFDVPVLEFRRNQSPRDISKQEKRRTDGIVLAAWADKQIIVRTTEGHVLNVEFANGVNLPNPGTAVCVAGFPQTDLFRVKLIKAHWRALPSICSSDSTSEPLVLTLQQILLGYDSSANPPEVYHGQTVRTDGIVQNYSPATATADGELRIGKDGRSLRIVCPCGLALPPPEIGATVRITGVCCQPCETWQPYLIFPHVNDSQIILTSPNDVVTIARPPWLTPFRVTLLLSVFGLGLTVVFFWNRRLNRLIVRRSRELAHEQLSHFASELKTSERTRLAVELHDTLSQNLAGLACLIGTAESALPTNPSLAQKGLSTANRMLQSCRTELRHCLFDLRNDMLEEPDFATAIRKTIAQLEPDAEISVRFSVPRSHFHDATAHAILSIVRELVSNALRHGKATSVKIAGSIENGTLLCSVTDNGTGFDPAACPGPSDGHFGIDGIRERLSRRNGRLTYESRPGQTYARIEIPLPRENGTTA